VITSLSLSRGDLLGAQLGRISTCICFALKLQTKVLIPLEIQHLGQGIQILKYFRLSPIVISCFHSDPLVWRLYYLATTVLRKFSGLSCIRRLCLKIINLLDEAQFKTVLKIYKAYVPLGQSEISQMPQDLALNADINFSLSFKDLHKSISSVKEHIQFLPSIVRNATENIQSIRAKSSNPEKPLLAIHIRRGDYITHASHVLSIGYFRQALNLFDPGDVNVVVFSDDIDYCRQTELFDDFSTFFCAESNPGVSMCMIGLCDSAILSNSSFGAWGVLLGKSKSTVVCPTVYHSEVGKYSKLNHEWHPDEWISI